MKKVYVTIAENGEHGIWSVSSYSSLEHAQEDLKNVAEKVANELGRCEYHGINPTFEVYEQGGFVTDESINISIDIHETTLKQH